MIRSLMLIALAGAIVAVETGSPAPDFALPAADGSSVELSAHQGQYVVLEWVNFDCPFVKKHYGADNMPALQRDYRAQDVVWLTICSSAPGKQGHFAGDALAQRMSSEGWAGSAYLIDADGSVGMAYDAKTTPHLFIVDPAGTLIYQGGIDSIRSADVADIPQAVNYVREALDAAMAGQAVPNPSTKSYGCSVKYP
jgi:peroxiredoxin